MSITAAAEVAADEATAAAEAVETQVRKAKAAMLNIQIQSPMGGNITPEEIAEKVPEGTIDVFVRVDQNKLWWVKKDGESGSVDIW